MMRFQRWLFGPLCRRGWHVRYRVYVEWRTTPALLFGRRLGWNANIQVRGTECRLCQARSKPGQLDGDWSHHW